METRSVTKIGIGVLSFNRPEYLEKVGKSFKNLYVNSQPVFDKLFVYNDGSDPKHHASYERAYKPFRNAGAVILDEPVNKGCAVAKNALLKAMLSHGCDWLFLLEDDIMIQSPNAVTEYVRIAEERGINHLAFAHHGPANAGGPVEVDGDVEYYPHSVGAWTLFSRECLMQHGLFDETFHNAWEHVHHEMELGVQPHRFPDIANSASYLAEIPGSIDRSSIRVRDDWSSSIRDGLLYWRDKRPETFDMMFGPGTPLENYARSITG